MHRTDRWRARGGNPPALGRRGSGTLLPFLLAALLGLTAAPLWGQVAWDAPLMVSPHAPAGWGIGLVDRNLRPGDGVGVTLSWRTRAPARSVGVRFGAQKAPVDGVESRWSALGGVDVTAPLSRATPAFPLDVSWFTGVGVSYGDYGRIVAPAGVVAGREIRSRDLRFHPYLAARAGAEGVAGGRAPRKNVDLSVALEAGFDLGFGLSPRRILRFAASLGERPGLGFAIVSSR